MLADIIFTILMLILPVVLCIVPKTRRNNGNWLIALKTVPLGLIAAGWSGELLLKIAPIISDRQERDFSFPFWLHLAVMLTAAFLVIILGGLFIKRKFGTEKKYNPGPSVLLFFVFLPPALILAVAVASVCELGAFLGEWGAAWNGSGRSSATGESEWRSMWLPREGNTGIAFQEQSIHPFLAEYNYRLCFSRDGERSYQFLLTNTGGRTLFNVYRLKDGRLLFRDKMWDYLVDVQGPECRVFRVEPFEGKLYAARIPNELFKSWSFVPRRENDEIVMVMGDQAVPAEDVTGILDGMTYFGCIEDRFYPAGEKPELEIKKMFEQEKAEGTLYY